MNNQRSEETAEETQVTPTSEGGRLSERQRDNPSTKGGPWELCFVENMRRLREMQNLTQTELARELKFRGLSFHQQTVQRIENGERPVRLNEAFLIAGILGVDLATMASYTGSDELALDINRVINSGQTVAWEVAQAHYDYLEVVERLCFNVSSLLTDMFGKIPGKHEPVLPSEYDFNDLPRKVQIGVALGVRCGRLARNLASAFRDFAEYFGDYRGETKPSKWEFNHVDYSDWLEEVELWASVWDCPELDDLISQSPMVLLKEATSIAQVPQPDTSLWPPPREPQD